MHVFNRRDASVFAFGVVEHVVVDAAVHFLGTGGVGELVEVVGEQTWGKGGWERGRGGERRKREFVFASPSLSIEDKERILHNPRLGIGRPPPLLATTNQQPPPLSPPPKINTSYTYLESSSPPNTTQYAPRPTQSPP